MKFDVYGTRVEVTRERGGWMAYYLGNTGEYEELSWRVSACTHAAAASVRRGG